MSIQLKNTSSYMGTRGDTDWWEWTAYIEVTPPDTLDGIKFVEYYLHPTFPNPVRRVRKKEGGFPLITRGWGVFELKAKVIFLESKKPPMLLSHFLEFDVENMDKEIPSR